MKINKWFDEDWGFVVCFEYIANMCVTIKYNIFKISIDFGKQKVCLTILGCYNMYLFSKNNSFIDYIVCLKIVLTSLYSMLKPYWSSLSSKNKHIPSSYAIIADIDMNLVSGMYVSLCNAGDSPPLNSNFTLLPKSTVCV